MLRFFKWLLVVVLLLVVSVAVFGFFTVRNSFPDVDGEVLVAGLDGDIVIIRDTSGIPHVYADTIHDLYFGQGYVQAQDRFWQMDFWRHIGQGRMSEMFGSSQTETDAFLRTLGFNATAEQELAALSPETKEVIESYAEGVNAWMEERSGSELSLEHFLVGLLYGYEAEPWEPIHTIAWTRMMAWELRSNIDEEIQRVKVADVVGVQRTEELYPPIAPDKPTILDGVNDAGLGAALVPQDLPELDTLVPLLESVRGNMAPLDELTGGGFEGIGSNNWVVSGELTRSGSPLLANDPHLASQMPSIWYENGLHCEPCGREMVGFSFAGIPGVVIGHNDRVAWGVTNFAADSMDLYVERVDPSDDGRYEVNGEWVDFDTRTEVIEVAGGDPVEIEVRLSRHGPILSDTLGALDVIDSDVPGLEGESGDFAISLAWTAFEPGTMFEALLGINTAEDWEDFRAATCLWSFGSQNFVYADVDGNIGYTATGTTPIRTNGDGRWPVPGWHDRYQWDGNIPCEDLPWTYNPPGGVIATANQDPFRGDDPWFGKDFAHGYRGARVYEVLGEMQRPLTLARMQALQYDSKNLSAEELAPALLAVASDDERVRDGQALIEEWGSLGDDDAWQQWEDSPHAAYWAYFWRDLLIRTFEDEVDPHNDGLSDGSRTGGGRFYSVLRNLVDDPENEWWDDKTTDEVETRDDILEASLAAGWDATVEAIGSNPDSWEWGTVHTVDFRNQSLGESGIGPVEALFNRGDVSTAGGPSIVNATGWNLHEGPAVVWLPSMRMIVDLANFDSSRTIHTTGQSGHAFHPNYFDFAEPWADGEYHAMRWSESLVRSEPTGTLTLTTDG